MAILHPATQLPPVTQNSRGLDELNLAEFPLTHLGSRSASAQSTLEFHDQVFDEGTQQLVDRSLLITGSPLLGLPGPVDADVLLTLMHLTQLRNGFGHRRIEFTRYELVQFLGWDHGGASWRAWEYRYTSTVCNTSVPVGRAGALALWAPWRTAATPI